MNRTKPYILCLLVTLSLFVTPQATAGSSDGAKAPSFNWQEQQTDRSPSSGQQQYPEIGNIQPKKTECCKRCKKGKACGDSCISRTKTCYEPPGCACQVGY